jgi:hypothetical protein
MTETEKFRDREFRDRLNAELRSDPDAGARFGVDPEPEPRPRLVELPGGNFVNPDQVSAIEYLPPYCGFLEGIPEIHRLCVSLIGGRKLIIDCESAEDARAKRSRIGEIVNGRAAMDSSARPIWAVPHVVDEDLERVAGMSRIIPGPMTAKIVAQMVPAGSALKLDSEGLIPIDGPGFGAAVRGAGVLGPQFYVANRTTVSAIQMYPFIDPSPEASLPAELRPAAEPEAIDRPPRGGYF